MKITKLKTRNLAQGFTILETIVAIAIVSLAIAGAASAVRIGLVGASSAKDQARGFYLAQEAIEIIRNMRDANALNSFNGGSNNWLTGIADISSDPCFPGKTCMVDATGPGGVFLSACSGGFSSCSFLRQNTSTFLYGYNGSWPVVQFKREVQIEKIAGNEALVTVLVSWTRGATQKSFKTKTILMDWF
ncbi:MAG TPA: type II secretion system protein [Candidatus Paceibacterota bacterium]